MKIKLFPDKNCARINYMTMTFYVFNLAITTSPELTAQFVKYHGDRHS